MWEGPVLSPAGFLSPLYSEGFLAPPEEGAGGSLVPCFLRSLQPGAVNTSPGRWDDVGGTDKGAGPRKTPERSRQLQQERLEGGCSSDGADVSSSADDGGHHRAPHTPNPLRVFPQMAHFLLVVTAYSPRSYGESTGYPGSPREGSFLEELMQSRVSEDKRSH